MIKQPECLVKPLRTPPLPAEALAFHCPHQVSPNFLFHPVLNKCKAPTGVPYCKVVHPASQDRVNLFDYLAHWFARIPLEDLSELRQSRRSLLDLWRVPWSPSSLPTPDEARLEAQETKAFAFPEVYDSALFLQSPRSLRLTALHSFFRYAAFEVPDHSAQIQRVLVIPSKRFTRALVQFLTVRRSMRCSPRPINAPGPAGEITRFSS